MRAIVIDEQGEPARLAEIDEADLPDGDVLVDVEWSTVNYKDSLAVTASSPVVRSFPMVPGIDLAGRVAASDTPEFDVGDPVVLNGWGVGESHWGGYAERARVDSDWLVPLPDAFDLRQAMVIGTAGYTAALCVLAIEEHRGADDARGPVLVTGATGGVGSIAVALLAARGHDVVASTGKGSQAAYLRRLGAAEVIDRTELSEPGRPLASERWGAAVDSVGSHTLANALAATARGGIVAACGLAQGMDLPASVAPFILRGVTLAGIDSVRCPRPRRLEAWDLLAGSLDTGLLDAMTEETDLAGVFETAERQMAGSIRGRVVVRVGAGTS